MTAAESPHRCYAIARIAHVTGDGGWWVFVVARLMAEMTSYGLPRRYADYSSGSLFTTALNQADRGWTAYAPLTDHLPPAPSDRFFAADIISACVIGALAVVIIAAVVEAIAVGRWPAGAGTVAAPVLGAAVMLAALHERAGNPFGGLQLNLVIVFVLVLVGVAFREVWSRCFAPRIHRQPDNPISGSGATEGMP